MRDLITVATYTIKEMVKRKTFIISNIIILLIIVLGFNVPNIIDILKDDKTDISGEDIVLIVDKENIFNGNLSLLNEMNLGKSF